MEKVQYILLYTWVKIHALLPMRVLYVLSDILYFFVYHVAKYRLHVVRSNMKASFPRLPDKQMLRMERVFYHHFCDYAIETIKLMHVSEKEIQRRAFVTNPEFIDRLQDKGYSTFVVYMGHFGNWEWFSSATSRFRDLKMYQVYRPLKNKAVDRLFVRLRTKFGAYGMIKNNVIRDMVRLKQEKERALAIFLADQIPSKANIHYWSMFLGQESAVYTGPERIARKMNLPAVYMDVKMIKRGYYEGTFRMLAENPGELPQFELTERYIRMMEQTIMRNPACWLWSHKRWKHKRETI